MTRSCVQTTSRKLVRPARGRCHVSASCASKLTARANPFPASTASRHRPTQEQLIAARLQPSKRSLRDLGVDSLAYPEPGPAWSRSPAHARPPTILLLHRLLRWQLPDSDGYQFAHSKLKCLDNRPVLRPRSNNHTRLDQPLRREASTLKTVPIKVSAHSRERYCRCWLVPPGTLLSPHHRPRMGATPPVNRPTGFGSKRSA